MFPDLKIEPPFDWAYSEIPRWKAKQNQPQVWLFCLDSIFPSYTFKNIGGRFVDVGHRTV